MQLDVVHSIRDHAKLPEEVGHICQQLLDIGRRWPRESLEDEAKAFERLGQQLPKFAASQQQDIVSAFRPLRDDVKRRMLDTTASLVTWLSESSEKSALPGAPASSSPSKLVELFQAIDAAPQMRWYKLCAAEADLKARFLVALASAIRAVPLRPSVAAHPKATGLAQDLAGTFFVLPGHGHVLETWHEARLDRYNTTLRRAGKRAAEHFKDELQVQLVSAIRKANAAPPQGSKVRPKMQLELMDWPMSGCPLAKAFLDFLGQRGGELGDLGRPLLSECTAMHSLRPRTLRKMLSRLDAFEVIRGDGDDMSRRRLIVRLRYEAVAALAFKAAGSKPKSASMASSPPPAPARHAAKAAPVGHHDAPKPKPSHTPSSAGSSASASTGAEPETRSGLDASGADGGGSRRLVQRKPDWGNTRLLQRMILRGLKAGDEEWSQTWHRFCKQKRVLADFSLGGPPKEALIQFVGNNLSTLLKKEWAKDLMYKHEGDSDDLPPESEVEPNGAVRAAREKAAIARKRRGSRSRDSSGSSDSSRSEAARRKRRKKEKRKMGYYDMFGQTISPEVVMMNQMMGMSMMMNNPLAMMGMTGAMPGYGMTGYNMPKIKNKDKTKRVEDVDSPPPAQSSSMARRSSASGGSRPAR